MRARTAINWIDVGLWAASAVLLVLSFVLSWGPPPPSPNLSWFDKVWHFVGYGALTGTVLLAAAWRPGRGDGRFPGAGRSVALFVLALAWLTEALQAPFGRDVQALDGLADLLGVAAGWLSWRLIRYATPNRGAGARAHPPPVQPPTEHG